MKRKLQYSLIILSVLYISAMIVFTVMNRNKSYSELEKRKLATFPKVSLSRILNGKFQKGFVDYLSDHFAFRDGWVTIKTKADITTGKKLINDIYIGKDDYLIEKYEDSDFEKDVIKENARYVSKFVNMASESIGTKHVKVVLVPGKARALKSKLPMFSSKCSMQEYMEKKLAKKINDSDSVIINLLEPLKKHDDEYIYYRTDHHWTALGAAYGYEEIKNSLGVKGTDDTREGMNSDSDTDKNKKSDSDSSSENEKKKDSKSDKSGKSDLITKPDGFKYVKLADDFYGTTYNKIHLKVEADVIEKPDIEAAEKADVTINDSGEITKGKTMYYPEKLKTADKYEYFLSGNYSQVIIDTPKDDGSTLIMVKDSYSNALVPYLCQDYDYIYMIDLRYANSSIFDTLQSVERFDDILLVYNEEKFMQDRHQYYLQ